MIGLAWSIDMLWPLIIVIPFWRLVIRPAFVSMYWDVSIFFFFSLSVPGVIHVAVGEFSTRSVCSFLSWDSHFLILF